MGGETEERPSGWSTDTLHSHIQTQLRDLRAMLDERYATQTKAVDAAFLAQQQAVQSALLAAEKAVIKAEVAADKRFDLMNEFRAQLGDQASTFMPRAESAAIISGLTEKIADLATRVDRSEGKSTGLNAGWVILGSVVGLALTIIVIYNILRGVSP